MTTTDQPTETHEQVEPPVAFEADEADWRPSREGVIARLVALGALVVVIVAIPHLVDDVYVNLVSRVAVYGIVALSMNVLVGYAGQVSLGHAAFFGVGAFGSAYGLAEMDVPWPAAVVLAAITGAVGAIVLGAVALRLQGLYLALVTISYGLFAERTMFNIRSLTGGGAGQEAPRPSFFESDVQYAYLCLGFLALALLFDWRLVSSRSGRSIQALRDDERVAASWGVNVTGYKLLAFIISGVLAGIAGALFASINQVAVAPDFGFSLSLTFLVMTVVGGIGNRWGVVLGGALFAVLPTLLDRAHENFHFFPFSIIEATWEPAIGALLLLLTLISFPGGLAQQLGPVLGWLQFRKFAVDHGDAGPATAGGGMGARP
ncbi:MAG TPA: branched-chain amino acid ABC transporter permease [Acidimicrobiales bacterium]